MKQYVITSPSFQVTSGGVRVLYGLLGWLLAKGQLAFINQRLPGVDTIAIYPEIQRGDPLDAKTVVRYILNKPGVVPALMEDGTLQYGPTQFDEKDILVYFSRLYGGDDTNTMFLPILDMHLFKDQKKKRTKTAFMIGKGMNYPLELIHPIDSIGIDRTFAQDQQALADLLNECAVLYCYDPNTAMTEVARLCGCPVIMINPLYTKEQFSVYEPGLYGITYANESKEVPAFDSNVFREHYGGMIKTFEEKLDQFIDYTQSL